MNTTQFINWLPELLQGLGLTVGASLVCIATSVLWGCLIASLASLRNPVLTPILRAYTSIFRNSPLLVQLFFCFYGLPFLGVNLSALACGILAVTLNEGAFIAEIVRGAIRNVPKGEIEAAYSLGLTRPQVVARVIFPLAVRASVPMITGQASIVIKDTSLFSMIMILDLTRAGDRFYSRYFSVSSIWIVAVIYIALFLIFNTAGRLIERRVKVRR